jgi:hypothetical protein
MHAVNPRYGPFTNTRWLNSIVFGVGMASLFSDLSYETDSLHHRKPLCAAGYGAMAAATMLIAAALTSPLVLAGQVSAWIAGGLRPPARKALLVEAVTLEKEAQQPCTGLE